MLVSLNQRLFLALNATDQSNPMMIAVAEIAASWLIYLAVPLMLWLWVRGSDSQRSGLIATSAGVFAGLGFNQLLGLLWFEPRPFMIHLGHTLVQHGSDNSFPSDHATVLWTLGLGLLATRTSRAWGTVVCLIGLLVAWSRIYLGLHFPLDMAGSFFVAIAASAFARLLHPLTHRWLLPLFNGPYNAALRSLHLPVSRLPSRRES